MVALPQKINVQEHAYEGGGGQPLIPQGQYQAVAVESVMKPTKMGQAIVFKIIIAQGEYSGTEFNEYANIVNPNEKAVKAGYSLIANIGKALGFSDVSDTDQLHNRPFIIDIKNEKQDDWYNNDGALVEGKMASKIKKYLPMPAAGAPQPSAFSAPTAAPFAAPATQTVQEAAAPQAATAPATNPFAQN